MPDFASLVSGRTQKLAVQIDLDRVDSNLELSAGTDSVQISIVQTDISHVWSPPPVGVGQRLNSITVDITRTSQGRRAEGVIKFTPVETSSPHTALHIHIETGESDACYRRPVAFHLGVFAIEPLRDEVIVDEMIRDGLLLRFPPYWHPISVGCDFDQKYTNIIPGALLPDAEGDPLWSLSHTHKRDIARLLREQICVIAQQSETRISVCPYVANELVLTDPAAPTSQERNAGVDELLNGENSGAALVADIIAMMVGQGPIPGVSCEAGLQVTPSDGSRAIYVAALKTDHYVKWLRDTGNQGTSLFGFAIPQTPSAPTPVIDIGVIWRTGDRRLPESKARRQERRDMPLATCHVVNKWLEVSGAETPSVELREMPDAPIAATASILAQCAQVLEGYFIASDGRLPRRWLSLPDCQEAIDDVEGSRSIQLGCHDLVSRVADRVSDHNDEESEARRLVVLNLCSNTSGICDDLTVLHDRTRWDPASCIGTVELSDESPEDGVTIAEDVIRNLLCGDTATLVVLVVPIDAYERQINTVLHYLRDHPRNDPIVVISLFSLDLGDHTVDYFTDVSVIPLVRVPVARGGGRVVPIGELRDVAILYPWVSSLRVVT